MSTTKNRSITISMTDDHQKINMKKIIGLIIISFLLCSCTSNEKVDILIYNATIYTVDSSFSVAQAMAIQGGKIIETGNTKTLQDKYDATETIDAEGKFIYPGLIDAHAHFVGYGNSLQSVNLVGTESWEEVIERTQKFAAENPSTGGWLTGRGWDQNDWEYKQFPEKSKLDALFPDRPVLLIRIDGHAAIANQKALDLAGIKPGDKIAGGEIETKSPTRPENSFTTHLTGILN